MEKEVGRIVFRVKGEVFKYLYQLLVLGSFVVVDAESLEQLAAFHHRKEEISDIKFSPSESVARHIYTGRHLTGRR